MSVAEIAMSPSLLGLVGDMMEGRGFISKIRKLSETLETVSDITPDDLTGFWSHSTDLLAVLSDSYTIMNANDAWAKCLGYVLTELKGVELASVIANTDTHKLKRYLKHHEGSVKVDLKFKSKNSNSLVHASVSISPVVKGKCYMIARTKE